MLYEIDILTRHGIPDIVTHIPPHPRSIMDIVSHLIRVAKSPALFNEGTRLEAIRGLRLYTYNRLVVECLNSIADGGPEISEHVREVAEITLGKHRNQP